MCGGSSGVRRMPRITAGRCERFLSRAAPRRSSPQRAGHRRNALELATIRCVGTREVEYFLSDRGLNKI